jgi:hypothetical protein
LLQSGLPNQCTIPHLAERPAGDRLSAETPSIMNKNISKYIVTFVITALLFITGFYLSNYFNNKKTADIKSTEDQIAIDLLSSETQFDILKQSSCSQLDDSILADELDALGNKLNYMESQIGSTNSEVIRLKKYYSILQIKDYLLISNYSKECHTKTVSIVYFYANNCQDCKNQGYVLTYLRDAYPGLRIYSFDFDIDLSAVKTLISLNKIPTELPALIINNKTYNGFMPTEEVEKIIKPLLPAAATTTATSTKTKIK